MEEFKITLNDRQKAALTTAGYEDLTENSADLMYFLSGLTEWLESHNKNYNSKQYDCIATLNEIITAIYNNR